MKRNGKRRKERFGNIKSERINKRNGLRKGSKEKEEMNGLGRIREGKERERKMYESKGRKYKMVKCVVS